MKKSNVLSFVCACFAAALSCLAGDLALAGVSPNEFSSFEMAQVHPLDITPDGTKLLAVNTAKGTLEVFNINGNSLTLQSVIKVGVEPRSVRAASNTQAWVVNGISNSVNIVDIRNNVVTATLQTGAEPADVVFAGSPRRAFVSMAQTREVWMYDLMAPDAPLARIPILGQQPRAMTTSADGSKVYLAIFESGNGTLTLSGGKDDWPLELDVARDAANPYRGVSPFPDLARGSTYVNRYLNATGVNVPPPVGVIVRRRDNGPNAAPAWLDANGVDWATYVNGPKSRPGSAYYDRAPNWDLVDRDVAIIDANAQSVSYKSGPLNIAAAIAVNPANGVVTTVGTEATNEIRYVPALKSKFIKVMLGGFQPGSTASTTALDLNPHLAGYGSTSLPVTCGSTNVSGCRQNSIGDPRGIAWNAAGTKAYVTGMGSNNVAVLGPTGARAGLSRLPIQVGQGPTGIVLQENAGVAYVLNRFDATISVISLATETEVSRVPFSYDPTPDVIKIGRPLLYNTIATSGLGQLSCASCHVDAKTDRLAWDLGDPRAPMAFSTDPRTGAVVPQHPMKGPLLTMTLVDTMQSPSLHWRGDNNGFPEFAATFSDLQGVDGVGSATDMANMQAFLATLRTPPNPFRTITNTYSSEVGVPGPRGFPYRTGNAVAGAGEFENGCRGCHVGQTGRNNLLLTNRFGVGQFRTPPRWQNFYRRDGLWFSDATASSSGFGFQQDGAFDSTHNRTRSDNMMAFMYSFNGSFPYTPAGLNPTNVAVDSHAAVGRQLTLSGSVTVDPMLTQLQALADARRVDLVASGCVANEARGYFYNAGAASFTADRGEAVSLTQLASIAASGSPITFTAVRAGTGRRIGIDENSDGRLDGAQNAVRRACVSGAMGNLLANGSFENNPVPLGGWQNTAIPGWTSNTGVVQVWRRLSGIMGADGSSLMQIDATRAVDTVSQTITSTAGDQLVLRFWYTARPGISADSNKFNVIWNGKVIDTLAPNAAGVTTLTWLQATYIVPATGRDTLTFAEAGANDTYGALVDAVSVAKVGANTSGRVNAMGNLAFGKRATQSSVDYQGLPGRAVDGDVNGNWAGNTTTHTGRAPQEWWQVDLGAASSIDNVILFNRSDCCALRLSNYYVFVSPTDMTGQTLDQLRANPSVTSRYVASAGYVSENLPKEIKLDFNRAAGRYVRIQLAGTNYLSLSEVKVQGWLQGER